MLKEEKELKNLKKEVEKLNKIINEKNKKKTFLCVCGKKHKVGDCECFQDWWEHPIEGTQQPGDFYVKCCNNSKIVNKIVLTYPRMYHFREIMGKIFKKMRDRDSVFNDSICDDVTNNDYFDRHHKQFGF